MSDPQIVSNTPSENLKVMAQDAAQVEKGGSGFMNPGAKKRGRPRKDTQPGQTPEKNVPPMGHPVPNPIEQNKVIVGPMIELLSHAGVEMAHDERAAMSEDVKKIATESGAQCLTQYFPEAFSKHAALIVFSLTIGQWSFGVFILRAQKIKEERERMIRQRSANEALNGDKPVRPPAGPDIRPVQ